MTPDFATKDIETDIMAWLATMAPEERAPALAALYERLRWRMEHGPS